jgi:hypothetical protein
VNRNLLSAPDFPLFLVTLSASLVAPQLNFNSEGAISNSQALTGWQPISRGQSKPVWAKFLAPPATSYLANFANSQDCCASTKSTYQHFEELSNGACRALGNVVDGRMQCLNQYTSPARQSPNACEQLDCALRSAGSWFPITPATIRVTLVGWVRSLPPSCSLGDAFRRPGLP